MKRNALKTVGYILSKLDVDTRRVLINREYLKKFPRTIKRLKVTFVWTDYYYDEYYGEDIKVVDITTTKGR